MDTDPPSAQQANPFSLGPALEVSMTSLIHVPILAIALAAALGAAPASAATCPLSVENGRLVVRADVEGTYRLVFEGSDQPATSISYGTLAIPLVAGGRVRMEVQFPGEREAFVWADGVSPDAVRVSLLSKDGAPTELCNPRKL